MHLYFCARVFLRIILYMREYLDHIRRSGHRRVLPNQTCPTGVIRFSGQGNGGPSPVTWTFVDGREQHTLRPSGALELDGKIDVRVGLYEEAIDALARVCIHPTDDLLRRKELDESQQPFVIQHPGYFLVK